MHSKVENIPLASKVAGMEMHLLPGCGGMLIAFNRTTAAGDSRPVLKDLPNGSCPVPHWGYVIHGSMKVIYDDGSEETVSKGDAFYIPPGHNGISDSGTVWIEFSPEKEMGMMAELMAKK